MEKPFTGKSLRKASVLVGLLSLMVAAPAMAASLLFSPLPNAPGGVLSYAGGATPLIGSIPLATGTLISASENANQAFIQTGTLNFTTGNATGTSPTGVLFGPGGTISLEASVLYPPGPAEPTVSLLQGTFTSATVHFGQPFQPQFDIFATFTDEKDNQLVSFFGLPTNVPYTGRFHLGGSQTGTAPYLGGPFTTTAFQGGVLLNDPIPEPSTWLLLGSGLVGLGLARRKLAI